MALGGSGNICSANFRLVDNRVTDVHYTGADDLTIGNDGVCEPVIRGCMRQPEATMQPVTGPDYDQSSAYSSPAVPRQPPEAEETEPSSPASGAAPKP